MKVKIAYVIGTRPEIIRSASLIQTMKKDRSIILKVIHTGQHYDYRMNKIFFDQFDLPLPDINLKVGSGNHGQQTAKILAETEKFLVKFNPHIVVVFGDTNSTLAAALAAVKLNIRVVHLEAGCREWERDMPEEINRRLVDHCSSLLFAFSQDCVDNLLRENVPGKIYNTGDSLYDVFKTTSKQSLKLKLWRKFGLNAKNYALLTLHRAKNVDQDNNLKDILLTLASFKDLPVIFPVHPRTKKHLNKYYRSFKKLSNFIFIDPVSYVDILSLVAGAKIVITDSGGLQKEAFWMRVPCMTLREHTAWIETVNLGANHLVGSNPEKIKHCMRRTITNYCETTVQLRKLPNPYIKPNITNKIIQLLKKFAKEPSK